DGASNLDELQARLGRVMLRRTKDQVLDLPPKTRTWLPVDVKTGLAWKETRQIVSILVRAGRARGPETGKSQLLGLLTKARHQLAAAKVDSTIDLVSGAIEQGEKVLVFSCFDEPVQRIAAHFGKEAVRLTGATPNDRRQELVDLFNKDASVRVFVA